MEIIEYWSKVHFIPAIANLGIRYAACKEPPIIGSTWLLEDDILNPDQCNRTRVPNEVETEEQEGEEESKAEGVLHQLPQVVAICSSQWRERK